MVDDPKQLWKHHDSSTNGINDRIPEVYTSNLTNSLYLIKANIEILVRVEGIGYPNPRRRIRCQFSYKGKRFLLSLTDKIIEKQYFQGEDGRYQLGEKYICISLGPCYRSGNSMEKYAYLFVASVI